MLQQRFSRVAWASVLAGLVLAGCNVFAPEPTPTPTPLPTATPTALPPIAPNVIDRFPARGDEMPLNAPIEVFFDTAMDRASVEAAFKLTADNGQNVAGSFSWQDDQTLTFQPNQALDRASKYTITIGNAAKSKVGLQMRREFVFNAETVGFLEVTQILPADGTFEVDPRALITVMFNRPVVPLTALTEQANLPNPLTLEPAVPGTGEWLNTSIYVFRPSQPLGGGVEYTARVAAGLQDTLGAVLQQSTEWKFTVAAPLAIQVEPFNTEFDVALNRPISITFNQPMDRASTEAAFGLRPRDGAPVAGSFRWTDDNQQMGFYPRGLLALETDYFFQVTTAAQVQGGATTLATPAEGGFRTVRYPAIINTFPRDGMQGVDRDYGFQIEFSAPMEVASLANAYEIVPAPTSVYTSWSEYSNSFFIGWTMRPSTAYTVTLKPGMRDPYGNPVNDLPGTVRFTTAAIGPQAYFNSKGLVSAFSAYLPTRLFVSSINVDTLNFELYRLQVNDFIGFTGNDSWSFQQNFVPAPEQLVRRWAQTVPSALNETILNEVRLTDDAGNTLPPGAYYLKMDAPWIYERALYQILMVSKYNLTVKVGEAQAFVEARDAETSRRVQVMVWATDLNTGQPVANLPVSLLQGGTRLNANGFTDANGVWQAGELGISSLDSYGYDPFYAFTGEGELFGMALSTWGQGVSPWDFNVPVSYGGSRYTGYLHTDRPIYRPGQVVYFKGVLRQEANARYAPDTGLENLQVQITDPNGEVVFSDTLPLSDFGTVNSEFKLGDSAPLGFYNLYLVDPARETDRYYVPSVASLNFSVAAYRKPEFIVSVTPSARAVVQGQDFDVTANASYFFGGPVSNAEVQWSVLSAQYFFNYTGPGYYSFSDYDYNRFDGDYGVFGRQIINQPGQTDAQGNATLRVPANLGENPTSQLFTIEANVIESADQQVAARTEVVVHAADFYAGIAPQDYVGTAGQPLAFDVIAVDWQSTPRPNQALSVSLVQVEWNCALERDPDSGDAAWTCTTTETPTGNPVNVTTNAQGRATASFTPPSGGNYKAVVQGRDAGGRTTRAGAFVWVTSQDYITWRQDNSDRIELVTDKRDYRPGDTAEILIPSPFQGEATALVTVERNNVIRHEVIRLTSNSTVYRLPITDDYAPNVFVSVLIVKGVDATNPAPAYKLGLINLPVSVEQLALTVTLTPDKTKVGPRDTVNYTLRATDANGQPVQAEFALALVDLAVLQLTGPNSQPMLEVFYSQKGLKVQTGLGLAVSVEAINLAADRAKGGGGGASAGLDEVRGDFRDTAYWSAVVRTNADGTAQVSVTLPDNLTTWRMEARGLTADTRVGQATVDIVATKDLLIRPVTPRFFVVGDAAELAAEVNNNTAQAIEATVSLNIASGLTLQSEAARTVTIPANGRTRVTWNVTVNDTLFADMTFSVEGGGLRDASKPTLGLPPAQTLPIYRYSVPETIGTAGQLDTQEAILEAVSLPRRFDDSQGALDVTLAPSLAATTLDTLEALKHYDARWESTEGTVSIFLPNAITFRTLKNLGVDDPTLAAELSDQVTTAIQRLNARQNVDGGWGWQPNEDSNVFTTAYALYGLVEAQRAGFTVSEAVLERAVNFLAGALITPDRTNDIWRLNRQAFVLFVMTEAGYTRVSDVVNLYERRTLLDTYAQALLALALNNVSPDDERVRTLLSDINSRAILSATGAHWEEDGRDWWNMNTDTRSTAIVLMTLARLDKGNALIPNVVRWLMVARTAQWWETPQETAWALVALTDWMTVSGELQADYNFRVGLNYTELAVGNANADTLRDTTRLSIAVADLLRDQPNRLVIERGPGNGRLYYTAHLNLYRNVPDVRAVSRGLSVSRQYFLADGSCGGSDQPECQPITQAAAGTLVQARVTLVAPNDLYYVQLEDYIPAGAELVDTSLQTTSIVNEPPQLNPRDPYYYGWGWWWFSNTQLRDEKVILSATTLPKGTYEYTYLLRVARPGTYNVIPTYARETYFPEVFATGDGLAFVITP